MELGISALIGKTGDTCFEAEVGLSHSSEEVPVMGMERRAWVIRWIFKTTTSEKGG